VFSQNSEGLSSMTGLWESALGTLEGRIKPHNFEMWLRPISCRSIDGQKITLSAPSKWIKEWFQDNYQSIVLDALRAQTNQEFEIVFEVREPDSHHERDAPAAEEASAAPASDGVPQKIVAGEKSEPHSDLLAKYTFEAFVVGPSNQLAHAASRAVAEVPAGKYNPLFIYGGVGLGKT